MDIKLKDFQLLLEGFDTDIDAWSSLDLLFWKKK